MAEDHGADRPRRHDGAPRSSARRPTSPCSAATSARTCRHDSTTSAGRCASYDRPDLRVLPGLLVALPRGDRRCHRTSPSGHGRLSHRHVIRRRVFRHRGSHRSPVRSLRRALRRTSDRPGRLMMTGSNAAQTWLTMLPRCCPPTAGLGQAGGHASQRSSGCGIPNSRKTPIVSRASAPGCPIANCEGSAASNQQGHSSPIRGIAA